MLSQSRRMSAIGDKDSSFVLALEIAGVTFLFGEQSRDITNRYGHPTVLHVRGTNLVESFTRAFDVASDMAADTGVAINDLKVPVRLPDAYRAGSGENLIGCKVELAKLRNGADWSQRWTQASGTVQNPTLMSLQAVEDTVSFSINQEDGVRFDFPSKDYEVAPGWLASGDTVTVADDSEEAFGLVPGDIAPGFFGDWDTLNFLFSTDDVVLTMPSDYADSPQYVPFVFGKPGIAGGDSDVELWKDLDGDGAIDSGSSFSVGVDERLRYFTTPGQTVAALTLGATSISDPDVETGTKLSDILAAFGFPLGPSDVSVIDEGDLISGSSTYTFGHRDVPLWVRVAIHAGKSAQVGSSIYMVDRANYGTPYSCSGSYTATLGFTERGRPYTYVDIKVDYASYLEIVNPADSDNSAFQVYFVLSGSSSEFHMFGQEWSGAGFDEGDAYLLWALVNCCWVGAIRSGGNTGDMLQAFFANPEVQRVTDLVFASKATPTVWQDVHMSCFNAAMSGRYTIKYPTAHPLDNHCPGNWTAGGQVFLDGAVVENPAELIMHMAELSGLAYDSGSLCELRDALRGWKIAGHIDDVTEVLDYITSVLQTYVPITVGKGERGITATSWKWDATKLDACHHFVEGIDLEVVGDGVIVEERGMVKSLRLAGRPVTWLHQESAPFATTKPVEDAQLSAKELKKLDRLRNNVGITAGWKRGHAADRRLKKFERELRGTYGSWDFSQNSKVTEQTDFWRVNNYTGDVEAAAEGKWNENALTFPVSDNERELWSRFIPHPLLVGAFRRYERTDRDNLVLELEDCYDAATLDRVGSWIIAARSQPRVTFQGLARKRNGWVVEGDVVRVTAPTLSYDDQVCLVVEKAWQQTNVLFVFRPIRLPARDTIPFPAVVVESSGAELVGDPEFELLIHFDNNVNIDIYDVYPDTGEFTLVPKALGSAVQSGDPVFGADGADLQGGRYVEIDFSIVPNVSNHWEWGLNPDLTIDIYLAWAGSIPDPGHDRQVFIMFRNVSNLFRIYVTENGYPAVRSENGGSTKLNIVSNTVLVVGQKTLVRFSTHAGVGSIWQGIVGDGTGVCTAVGADATTFTDTNTGHLCQIDGDFGGANQGSADVDEVAVLLNAYMPDAALGVAFLMPTAAFVGPWD